MPISQTMKTFCSLLLLLMEVSSGSAQGLVTFEKSVQFTTLDPTGGNRLVYQVTSEGTQRVPLAGPQFVAELYAGTDAGSLAPVTSSISRFRATTSVNAGKWTVRT